MFLSGVTRQMKILLVVFLLFGFLVLPSTEIRCYNCTYNADVEGLPCLDPRKPGNKVDKTYGSYCEVITSPQPRGFSKLQTCKVECSVVL